MSDEQWVNLPKHSDYVADSISSKERLGPARFKVKFKKASLAGFRVNLIPIGNHERYSAAEQKRNPGFRVRAAAAALNNAQQEVVIDTEVFLNAAGGNEYKIQAQYRNKKVESGLVLAARRKLFYQVMSMHGIAAKSTASLEKAFWDPARKFYIQMKKHGSNATTDYIPCLDTHNDRQFIEASARAYALKKYKPYAFGINFVNYIATSTRITIERELNFSLPSKIMKPKLSGEEWSFQLYDGDYLWYELDPNDDAQARWFEGGSIWFEPDSSPGTRECVVPLTKNDVRPSGPKMGPYGGRSELTVTLPLSQVQRKMFSNRKGRWKIELVALIVEGFSGGFAYNDINLIAIATKSWWQDNLDAEYVLNHEVGHMIGMVANGKGKSPDTHAHLYGDVPGSGDPSHQGPHCSKGAHWDTRKKRWSGKPGCVMFGADSLGQHASPPEFCDDCAKIVRKLDLSAQALQAGSFKISMEEY